MDHSNTKVPSSSRSKYACKSDEDDDMNVHKAHKALDATNTSGSRRKHGRSIVTGGVCKDGSGREKDNTVSHTEGKYFANHSVLFSLSDHRSRVTHRPAAP